MVSVIVLESKALGKKPLERSFVKVEIIFLKLKFDKNSRIKETLVEHFFLCCV
jgi:hypothetical protein